MPKYTHKYTKHKHPQKTKRSIIKRRWKLLFYTLLATGGLIVLGYLISKAIPWTIAFVQAHSLSIILALSLITIGIAAFLIFKAVRKLRARRHKNPLIYSIEDTLKIMDKIGHHYTNENEANKELIGILVAKGFHAIYQPQDSYLGNPDGIVNDTILEGKLDLVSTEATDRLIGQLQRYCQTKKLICIVLYGFAEPNLLKRIQDEVSVRYSHQVEIAHLPNAHRRR